jgi:hypothetical protein
MRSRTSDEPCSGARTTPGPHRAPLSRRPGDVGSVPGRVRDRWRRASELVRGPPAPIGRRCRPRRRPARRSRAPRCERIERCRSEPSPRLGVEAAPLLPVRRRRACCRLCLRARRRPVRRLRSPRPCSRCALPGQRAQQRVQRASRRGMSSLTPCRTPFRGLFLGSAATFRGGARRSRRARTGRRALGARRGTPQAPVVRPPAAAATRQRTVEESAAAMSNQPTAMTSAPARAQSVQFVAARNQPVDDEKVDRQDRERPQRLPGNPASRRFARHPTTPRSMT